ncbi:MAG: 3-phenylpropionate/cinnamic acid dioxygenase subunit beta [Terrimesophilobacter sp.]
MVVAAARVDRDTVADIQDFLYREALAIDERRFRDWLSYFADDATYVVPVRVSREGLAEWELSPVSRIFDDNKQTLEIRVKRLETDFAWSEQPPSRTRHNVSNIIVERTDLENEYLVSSNSFIYRSRSVDANPSFYSLARKDTIRRTAEGWEIARRWAAFDQAMINANNLSIFV